MKTFVKLIFSPLILLLHLSCDSVGPDDNSNGIDTTSHNFTFKSWTFGEHSGSILYDAAIINDTLILAVGEIYLNDSLGQPDPQPYNLAVWDGENWKLQKLTYQDFPPVIHSVFSINENNVWFDPWFHWDGQTFQELPIDPILIGVRVNKIWGNSDGIYVVGDGGFIAYRNTNGSWSNIGSRTTLNINDIWGITDQYGIKFILCPAYDFASGGEKKLISISNNTVGEIPWMDNRELYTVWFNTREKIYAGGEGLFYRANNQWKEETLPALFKFRVRGNGLNDIWTVGGFGFAAHYNGKNWKTFEEVSLASGNYVGLAVKGNTVVMTGNDGNKAVITIGKRN